jgi:hypothetical protein
MFYPSTSNTEIITMSTKRSRTKVIDEQYGDFVQTFLPNGTPYYPHTHLMSYGSFTIDDVLTPNFRKRSANGEVIVNPCTMYGTKLTAEGGASLSIVNKSNGQDWWSFTGDGSFTQWASNRAGLSILPVYKYSADISP